MINKLKTKYGFLPYLGAVSLLVCIFCIPTTTGMTPSGFVFMISLCSTLVSFIRMIQIDGN